MKVGLIMGSDSDFPVMKKAIAIFKEFGIEYEVLLASAHRTPAAVREFVSTAEERGISAFVVGAGMAGHPGIASGMFGVLGKNNINIEIISTSEISITCLISEDVIDKAVKAIHAHFFDED